MNNHLKVIPLKHPLWQFNFYLDKEKENSGTLANRSRATIEEFNENIIYLSWEKFGKEYFYRDSIENQHTYYHVPINYQLVLDSQELLIHTCSTEKSPISFLPYQKIIIKFCNYDYFYFENCISNEIVKKIREFDSIKRILFFGGCKEVNFSVYLACKLATIFPALQIGVVGSPIPIDFSDSKILKENPGYSPAIKSYQRSEVFNNLLKKNGDIKRLLEGVSNPPYIFANFCTNEKNKFDEEQANRIDKFLFLKENVSMSNDYNYTQLHRRAFSMFKDEEYALNFFKKCFSILKNE